VAGPDTQVACPQDSQEPTPRLANEMKAGKSGMNRLKNGMSCPLAGGQWMILL
jgi:hypothetical protein